MPKAIPRDPQTPADEGRRRLKMPEDYAGMSGIELEGEINYWREVGYKASGEKEAKQASSMVDRLMNIQRTVSELRKKRKLAPPSRTMEHDPKGGGVDHGPGPAPAVGVGAKPPVKT